jgi:pyruvate kinase
VVDEMSLVWGVRGLAVPLVEDLRHTIKTAIAACVGEGLIKKGDRVVVTGGFLDEKAGTTNMIHIHTVG